MKIHFREFWKETTDFFSSRSSAPSTVLYDIVFVLPPKGADGWILAGICKEIASRLPRSIQFRMVNFGEKLPLAKWYFFSHYIFYIGSKKKIIKDLQFKGSCIFFTHLEAEKHGVADGLVFAELGDAECIVCMNSGSYKLLTQRLKNSFRIKLIIGAADHNHFKPPSYRSDNFIGFSANYYERKNPKLMLQLIKAMPEEKFLLIGSNWANCTIFEQLLPLRNFQYASPTYQEYPAYYHMMRALISTSVLEGGPIPLIEALMTNIPVIATRTGFAEDIITHGKNGYIFDVEECPVERVVSHVKQLGNLEQDTRTKALRYSWDNFSNSIIEILIN